MHGVKLAQITVRATRKEIALLRKAATRSGSGTPAKFVASLFEETPLTHHYQEPRTVRRPKL
jgi:hypothetical protein